MRESVPERRRRDLLAILSEEGQVAVNGAAERLGVSADTVRRDLDQLAAEERAVRTHGGAVRVEDSPPSPMAIRATTSQHEKSRIASTALGYLHDGQTLLLNGGSTVLAVAHRLTRFRELAVVTNNLLVPSALRSSSVNDVYLYGGEVRLDSLVTIGEVAISAADGSQFPVGADVALMGVGGVTADGFFATNVAEARMMRKMMDSATTVLVLCDSTKFEKKAFANVAPLSVADVLITDAEPPAGLMRALAAGRVEVRVAPVDVSAG